MSWEKPLLTAGLRVHLDKPKVIQILQQSPTLLQPLCSLQSSQHPITRLFWVRSTQSTSSNPNARPSHMITSPKYPSCIPKPLQMGKCCPETSVNNYQRMMRNKSKGLYFGHSVTLLDRECRSDFNQHSTYIRTWNTRRAHLIFTSSYSPKRQINCKREFLGFRNGAVDISLLLDCGAAWLHE